MNAELVGYQDQLLSIRQQVPGLVARLSDAQFNWRPGPNRWSMAQCFGHLNVTAGAFVPAIDRAIAQARVRALTGSGPFVYSLFERICLRANEPPPRLRLPAPRVLAPAADAPMDTVLGEFTAWQDRLAERIRLADGLDLRRTRSRSPAFPLLTWSLGSLFAITLAHERRHLWQAREVRKTMT